MTVIYVDIKSISIWNNDVHQRRNEYEIQGLSNHIFFCIFFVFTEPIEYDCPLLSNNCYLWIKLGNVEKLTIPRIYDRNVGTNVSAYDVSLE